MLVGGFEWVGSVWNVLILCVASRLFYFQKHVPLHASLYICCSIYEKLIQMYHIDEKGSNFPLVSALNGQVTTSCCDGDWARWV